MGGFTFAQRPVKKKKKNPLCQVSHQFLAGTSIIAFISLRDVAVLIS